MTSREILNKLLQSKLVIIDKHGTSKVIIFQPTFHTDKGKTTLTNKHLCSLLEELNIDIIKNKIIVSLYAGGKQQ